MRALSHNEKNLLNNPLETVSVCPFDAIVLSVNEGRGWVIKMESLCQHTTDILGAPTHKESDRAYRQFEKFEVVIVAIPLDWHAISLSPMGLWLPWLHVS